jgi:hypothetical protein
MRDLPLRRFAPTPRAALHHHQPCIPPRQLKPPAPPPHDSLAAQPCRLAARGSRPCTSTLPARAVACPPRAHVCVRARCGRRGGGGRAAGACRWCARQCTSSSRASSSPTACLSALCAPTAFGSTTTLAARACLWASWTASAKMADSRPDSPTHPALPFPGLPNGLCPPPPVPPWRSGDRVTRDFST